MSLTETDKADAVLPLVWSDDALSRLSTTRDRDSAGPLSAWGSTAFNGRSSVWRSAL